jgi:branched-chain amino acid transport system permease protein
MNYLLHILIYLEIYVLVALSLNLVVGYCGLMTLAHSAYFAIGAYSYALLSLKLHIGFVPSVALGALIAAVCSVAVTLPAWRFRGDFFVMASLAVQALLFSAAQNWNAPGAPIGSLSNLTNGPFGIPGVPKPDVFGWRVTSLGEHFVLGLLVVLMCAFAIWCLISSPWGRLLKALRDDELAARGLGKSARSAKAQAFAIACALAAIAGGLYASYVNYIDPSSASLDESLLMLCMVLVGGVGNFRGPIIGAAVLIAIPEMLRFAHLPDSDAAHVRLLLYGLILVGMAHFRPQGLVGEYRLQ